MNPDNWIEDNTIFLCKSGSHAYGLATESSDEDIRGVCIPPLRYYYGLQRFEQKDSWPDGADKVVYSISKFVQLALNCNPNIIELFFIPQDCLILNSWYWRELKEHRLSFISRQAANSYMGYAMSQMKRLQNGRINIPREGRNPERALMEAKHGYDCKHASHLMRLLYQGRELLETGQLTVRLSGDQLEVCRGLKTGQYTYEEMLSLAEDAKEAIRKAEQQSGLPDQPNRAKIDFYLTQITRAFHDRR